jgi:hypothetical protein
MSNDPPIIYFDLEKRRRVHDTLCQIMASDSLLRQYQNLLDPEYIFSPSYGRDSGAVKPIRDWVNGQKHLVVFHTEATGKIAILCFEVVASEISSLSVGIENVLIELSLYSHVTHVEAEPYVIHVVSPEDGQPIRYRHHIGRVDTRAFFETADICISDLVDRFPGQVENILAKVLIIAGVILRTEGQ